MKTFRDILRWWQSLSPAAKVICTIAMLAVIAALGAAMQQGYSAAAMPGPSLPGDDATATEPSPKSILSFPLPGTRQRKEVEIAQRLESALSRYDYIASARALFATSLTKDASPGSPHLMLQLQLDHSSTPPQDWVKNLVILVRHTVPDVEPANLLITDTSGTMLFSEGRPVRLPQHPAAAGPLPASLDSTAVPLSTHWLTASALTAICALLTVAVFWALRRRAEKRRAVVAHSIQADPSPADQPLQFMSELTAPQIAALLRRERPQVAAIVLKHVPDEVIAGQARQTLHLAADGPAEATRPPRHETLLALAEALRVKAMAGQDGPGGQPTVPILHGDSQGD